MAEAGRARRPHPPQPPLRGENGGEPLRRVISMRGITIPVSEQEAARIMTVAAERGMSTAEFVEQMFRAGMVATETATAGRSEDAAPPDSNGASPPLPPGACNAARERGPGGEVEAR